MRTLPSFVVSFSSYVPKNPRKESAPARSSGTDILVFHSSLISLLRSSKTGFGRYSSSISPPPFSQMFRSEKPHQLMDATDGCPKQRRTNWLVNSACASAVQVPVRQPPVICFPDD